jgi:hypothetical protein
MNPTKPGCDSHRFPGEATNLEHPGSYESDSRYVNLYKERRSSNVSNPGCGAGFALARRVLCPARKQLPDSSAAYLRLDLHHHELR